MKIDKYKILYPYGAVYLILNKINNKKYIGITTRDVSDRFREHCKANSYIGRAIRKYGEDNFSIQVIDTAYNKDDLFNLEIKYISQFDSYRNGYNQTIGGDGAKLVEDLEITLTEKQKKFCNMVDSENNKDIDVYDNKAMIKCIAINLTKIYLCSQKARDKIKSAKLLLEMNRAISSQLIDAKIINIDEVNHYAHQKISSFERWCEYGEQTG